MAIGSFNPSGDHMPTAEINMTPMVDVMLVLLIIFIITAPLLTHSVPVDLPRAASSPTQEKPQVVQLAIDAAETVFIGQARVDRGAIEAQLRAAVSRDPRVELHLRADAGSRYAAVAEVISAARRAGISRIAFVTQPGESAH